MGDESRVNKPVRIIPQKPPIKPGKKKEQEEHKHKDEAGDHFQQLSNPLSLLMIPWKETGHLTGSVFIKREKRFLLI